MNKLTQHDLVILEGRATYERIVSYIREVETTEAISQIQNFLKIYPEFALAHNDLAVLYYQTGNGMKALAHYEKAHKLDPANITFRKNLADFYFVELEWAEDAIHTYLEILKDNPFDTETLNALGTISQQVGRREQARQYFTRTLQLDTVNSQARMALLQLGDHVPPAVQQPRITEIPQTAVDLHIQQPAPSLPLQPSLQPISPEQLHRQALDQMNAGLTDVAQRILHELILLYPGYAVAHNDLGVIYQQGRDFLQAKHHHAEALRLEPENITFQKNLADLLYIACGETEEALSLYVKILSINPRDIETLSAISTICIEMGNFDDARSFLENILSIDPWNADARATLADISQPADRGEKELYAEALQYVQEGRLIEAQEMLEELIHISKNNAFYHNDLGVVRYQLGNSAGAQHAYEMAVELEPLNSTFSKNLADLYFAETGMTDAAIHIYLELFRQSPRDVETLSNLGHISAALGQNKEAQSFYRRVLEIEPWNSNIRTALQSLS